METVILGNYTITRDCKSGIITIRIDLDDFWCEETISLQEFIFKLDITPEDVDKVWS